MPAHGIVAPTPRVKQLLDHAGCLRILKYMLEQMTDPDRTILALADDSGCFGVERLPPGPASVGDVVEPPAMALSGVLRQWYVDDMCVVDTCGVVKTEKVGRTRMCQIEPAAMSAAEMWIADRRRGWGARLDRLGDILHDVATTEEEP